jgi:hypothetical protein
MNTDIDGSPILIVSLEEAALAHVIVVGCGYSSELVKRLETKLLGFLEEANENTANKEAG